MRAQILLVGTEFSRNRGTASIALSAVNEMRRVFDNPDITVLSYFEEKDRRFEKQLGVRIPEAEPKIMVVAETILLMVERALRIRIHHRERRKSFYQNSDVMVNLAGDGYNDDYGTIPSILAWLPFLWCIILRTPMVVYSQSIGPFRSRIALRVARFFLDRVDLLMVREEITRNYLIQAGVRKEPILTADGAFILDPISEPAARQILEREGIPSGRDRPLVGVAPSELMFKFSRSRDGGEEVQYVQSIAELLDHMIQEHDVDVMFVPHVTDDTMDTDDRDVAVDIASKCRHRERIYVIQGEYRPEELRGVIGMCTLFIGSRMHANIAAMSMYVPTVAISYSIKTPGIMSLAGLGDYVVSWTDPPEKLLQKVERAFANRVQTKQLLLQRIPEVKRMARASAELVHRFVEQRKP